jgi:hypothetical protein
MRVTRLMAENVKRIKAIDITPTDDVVVIAGRNAQGKTSVLDAIWWALAGARSFSDSPNPVRNGQKHATARVDLGDLTVVRTWTAGGPTKLTVTAADGVKLSSPQEVLDRLIGSLSFDPLAFANTDAKTQRKTLLGMVELPFDLDELDSRRATIFDERTDANRDHKKLANALSLLDPPAAEEPGAGDIGTAMAALRAGTELKAANDRERASLTVSIGDCDRARREVEELERRLHDAREKMRALETERDRREEAIAFLPDDPDIDVLQAAVADADRAKDGVRLAAEYAERVSQVEDAKGAADRLTVLLEEIDAEKLAGLQAARMPIPGLSVDDECVLFGGVPLAQCSGAERLRVSLAIAMAKNPELRVCHIKDGSLLDDDSLELVREMAAFEDFQVWLEMVDSSGQVGIVIEDGSVVAVNEAAS